MTFDYFYEAAEEKQNFAPLLEMLNSMDVRDKKLGHDLLRLNI